MPTEAHAQFAYGDRVWLGDAPGRVTDVSRSEVTIELLDGGDDGE